MPTLLAYLASAVLDLSPHGVKATIQAPEGATAKQFLSSTRVAQPPRFSIEITGIYPMEFDSAKSLAKTQSKVVFHVESADTLLWENQTQLGTRAFHFYTTVPLEGKLHACWNSEGFGDFSRADVDTMLAACRTLKAGGASAAAAPARKDLKALKADAPKGWENPSFGGGTWTFEKHAEDGWSRIYINDTLPEGAPATGEAYAAKLKQKDWQDFGIRYSEILGSDAITGGFIVTGFTESTTNPSERGLGVTLVRDLGGIKIRCRGTTVLSEDLFKEAVHLCLSAGF